jgi:hypothetical protein
MPHDRPSVFSGRGDLCGVGRARPRDDCDVLSAPEGAGVWVKGATSLPTAGEQQRRAAARLPPVLVLISLAFTISVAPSDCLRACPLLRADARPVLCSRRLRTRRCRGRLAATSAALCAATPPCTPSHYSRTCWRRELPWTPPCTVPKHRPPSRTGTRLPRSLALLISHSRASLGPLTKEGQVRTRVGVRVDGWGRTG